MKVQYFIVLIIFVLSGCAKWEMKKVQSNKDFKMYKEAYLFLYREISEEIDISDTIEFLEIEPFWNFILEGTYEKMEVAARIDKERKFESYYEPLLKEINDRDDSSEVLFFSKPYQNYLIVEIIDTSDKKNKSYSNVTRFNNGKMYLFEFNKIGSIENYYSILSHYD